MQRQGRRHRDPDRHLAQLDGLFTAGGAADTGFNVIVPVDGIPADTIDQEQFTVLDLANGDVLQQNSTLTRLDLIKF